MLDERGGGGPVGTLPRRRESSKVIASTTPDGGGTILSIASFTTVPGLAEYCDDGLSVLELELTGRGGIEWLAS